MSFWAALANFALLSYAQRQITKSMEDARDSAEDTVDEGVRLQLNPSTETKIPVLYGEAYFSGNITDVAYDAPTKSISYVITLAELTGNKLSNGNATGYTFHDVYLNNNRVVFKADGFTVDYTLDAAGNQDINMRDLVKVYLYSNAPLQPDGAVGTTPASDTLLSHWDAINHPMTNLMYAVVQVTYNQSKGVNSLPKCTFHVESDMTLPGDVLDDYIKNTSYGAGIAASDVDTSLVALNTYCNAGFNYTDSNSVAQTGPIGFNGLVDTATACLRNMTEIATAGNAWLSYDIHEGKWTTIINDTTKVAATALVNGTQYAVNVVGTTDFTLIGATDNNLGTVFTATGPGTGTGRAHLVEVVATITDSHIVGQIGITGTQLTQLSNIVDVQYQNSDILDKTDFVKLEIDNADLFVNEPETTLQISLPFTNKQSVAMKLGLVALKQARVDEIITFKTDFSFINLKAGEIIDLSTAYGDIDNKLYRIMTVTEVEGTDGTIQVDITALEYVLTVYDYDLTELSIETDDGILGIGSIGKPDVPIVTKNDEANIPHVLIAADVPSGIVDDMEYWLTTDVAVVLDIDRDYIKIGIQSNTNGQAFAENDTVTFQYNNLTAGDFFIKVRGSNALTVGEFSNPTGLVEYVPVVVADALSNIPVPGIGDALMQYGMVALLTNLDDLYDIFTGEVGIMEGLEQIFFPGSTEVTASSIPTQLLADQDFLDALPTGDAGPTGEAGADGASSLTLLSDTAIASPSADDTLVFNGTNWVATPGCCDAPDEPGDVGDPQVPGGCFALTSLSPSNGDLTAAYIGSVNLTFAYSPVEAGKSLIAGAGSAHLYTTDGTLVESIAGSGFTIVDMAVSIPFADRQQCTDYYILLDEGMVKVAGDGCLSAEFITGDDWHFTTKVYEAPDVPIIIAPPAPIEPTPPPEPPPAPEPVVPDDPCASTTKTATSTADLFVEIGGAAPTIDVTTVASGAFVTGTVYTITVTGTTDFTLIGAANSNVGTVFTATGPGTGTGEATIPAGTGNATLYKSDGTVVETWAAGDPDVTVTPSDLDIISVSPIDGEVDVVVTRKISITYEDTITANPNGGMFYLYVDGTTLVQTFDVLATFDNDNTYKDIILSNSTVTLNPTVCFIVDKTYHIEADLYAVVGSCDAASAAITDNTILEFSTVPAEVPVLGQITVPPENINEDGIVINYDEAISRGTGDMRLYDSNNNLIDTIPANDSRIQIT